MYQGKQRRSGLWPAEKWRARRQRARRDPNPSLLVRSYRQPLRNGLASRSASPCMSRHVPPNTSALRYPAAVLRAEPENVPERNAARCSTPRTTAEEALPGSMVAGGRRCGSCRNGGRGDGAPPPSSWPAGRELAPAWMPVPAPPSRRPAPGRGSGPSIPFTAGLPGRARPGTPRRAPGAAGQARRGPGGWRAPAPGTRHSPVPPGRPGGCPTRGRPRSTRHA
jgi:hypothetical protein